VTENEVLDLLRSLPGTAVVTASQASGAPDAAWGDSFAIHSPTLATSPIGVRRGAVIAAAPADRQGRQSSS
jgi:hypothetical protein